MIWLFGAVLLSCVVWLTAELAKTLRHHRRCMGGAMAMIERVEPPREWERHLLTKHRAPNGAAWWRVDGEEHPTLEAAMQAMNLAKVEGTYEIAVRYTLRA